MSCIVCSDAAFLGHVLEVAGETAVVAVGPNRLEVAIELVAPVCLGDVVICHAGVALEKVGGAA